MLLYLSLTVGFILVVWFKTNAYIEYCKFLKINFISFYKDYEIKKNEEDVRMTYPDYLLKYHECFFTRLLSCPICTSFWIAIVLCGICQSLALAPAVALGGLFSYLIIEKIS